MKKFKKLTRPFRRALAFIPHRLPIGMAELEAFTSDVIELYQVPDFPGYHHAVATMIMHIPTDCCRASKNRFGVAIYKAMANQVAFEKIQMIKEQEKREVPPLAVVANEKVP